MLNFNSHRWVYLLINSITHQRIARPLRLNPLPGLLYIELYPTLAAPPAQTRPAWGSSGNLTHGGRTPTRIRGCCPTLAAYRLERCRGGRRAFGTGGRALWGARQRGNGIPLKIYTAVAALPFCWVPCRPKPKQPDRRRVEVFYLGKISVGLILFLWAFGGQSVGRLLGWCWRALFAFCRPCPPAGTGNPIGAAKKQGETDSLWVGSLLGWAIFVSVGLVRRNRAKGLGRGALNVGCSRRLPPTHGTAADGALCVWLTESRCRCAQRITAIIRSLTVQGCGLTAPNIAVQVHGCAHGRCSLCSTLSIPARCRIHHANATWLGRHTQGF